MKAVIITDYEMAMLKTAMLSHRAYLRKRISQGKDWEDIYKKTTILVNKLDLFHADEFYLTVKCEEDKNE